jgi:chemotaxis protein MotA
MDPRTLIDPVSFMLVSGGTILATVLRAGPRAFAIAMRECLRLPRRRFNAEKVRAALAGQINAIRADGLIRARFHETGDKVFDEAVAAMLMHRSVGVLRTFHAARCRLRTRAADTAARTWSVASDLAPAFGLAGTLLSLSQLPSAGFETAGFNAVISGAVLTTLYGVLLANLLFAPLADAIERAAAYERAERQGLIDWLADQLADAEPHLHDTPHRAAA